MGPRLFTDPHNLTREVNQISQALSQDKKQIGFFLGAGCPASVKDQAQQPLIPTIPALTAEIAARLAASQLKEPYEAVTSQLIDDGNTVPDIEAILSQIRSLQQVAGSAEARGLTADTLAKLDESICEQIVQIVDKRLPDADTAYQVLAAWTANAFRVSPVQFFTVNYDLLLEQALESYRVPYFDGFVGSCEAFFDPYAMEDDQLPPRWCRLWKLHGSINWVLLNGRRVSRTSDYHASTSRLIHPSHLKYDESRRMPYLAMIDRLRAFLKSPEPIMVICGYSFRDEHINETLLQGLSANPLAVVFTLLYGSLAGYPEALRLAHARPNLNLLANDGAVVRGRPAPWNDPTPGAPGHTSSSAQAPGRYVLDLGDFHQFGVFLRELIGRGYSQSGESS